MPVHKTAKTDSYMVKMAGSVNFHVALARGTTADESSGLLRACGSLRCRSGRCLTSGLRSTPVVARRMVYAPLRSLLDKRSTFHFGRCWTRAIGTQQPSSYLGVIKCAYTGSSKLAPAPAHSITFIVIFICFVQNLCYTI